MLEMVPAKCRGARSHFDGIGGMNIKGFKKNSAIAMALGIVTFGSVFTATAAPAPTAASTAEAVQAAAPVAARGIEQVTSIGYVYGDGEKAAGAALKYPSVLQAASLSVQDFSVPGRDITAVYTNDRPELTTKNVPGPYAILTFGHVNSVSDKAMPGGPPKGGNGNNGAKGHDAPRNSNRVMPDISLAVTQTGVVTAEDGTVYMPSFRTVTSSVKVDPSLAGFKQYEYTDPATGYKIPYQLYLPKDYDAHKKYPLLFFIADASANTKDEQLVLVQGNGATIWAEPQEQAKHECIILAPAYTRHLVDTLDMMTTDDNVWTPGLTLVSGLLFDVIHRYNVDTDRIYGTGQSQGGMANIAISDKYPDLFAAQFLVACQWNVKEMEVLKDKNLWILVSEGDTKAYPAMNEATTRWQELGTKIGRSAHWDSKSTPAEFAALVKQVEEQKAHINYTVFQGGNHMYTWSVAYTIEGIRDWLFAQTKSGKQ